MPTTTSANAPDHFITMLHAALKLSQAPGIPLDLSNIHLSKVMDLVTRAGIVLQVKFTREMADKLCA